MHTGGSFLVCTLTFGLTESPQMKDCGLVIAGTHHHAKVLFSLNLTTTQDYYERKLRLKGSNPASLIVTVIVTVRW